jgi:hypothetical protein
MNPEKRRLLDDVLGGARREDTLRAGAGILRHRRWKRAAARSLAGMAVLLAVALVIPAVHQKLPHPVVAQSAPAASAPAAVLVEYLTDDQLLALFPDTPVGLIRTADGRKHLIFPHPGDEAKFITRL